MATIKMKGLDEYMKQINSLADVRTIDAMCKYSLYDAAGMVCEEIKKATPVGDTGDLRDSVSIQPMKTDASGYTSVKVDFGGYDSNGVPNQLKARAIESGHSVRKGDGATVGKHPFVRPTVKRVTTLAEFMIDKALNEYISKFMKKEK